ncbi:MAG: hypothetical protein ACK4UN_08985 [Limisphaerales bacterium]
MPSGRTRRNYHLPIAFKAAWSVFTLMLFLFVQTVAASSVLHEHFHDDADSASHFCAATLLAKGQIDLVHEHECPRNHSIQEFAYTAPASLFLPATDYRLQPGRGPPA